MHIEPGRRKGFGMIKGEEMMVDNAENEMNTMPFRQRPIRELKLSVMKREEMHADVSADVRCGEGSARKSATVCNFAGKWYIFAVIHLSGGKEWNYSALVSHF